MSTPIATENTLVNANDDNKLGSSSLGQKAFYLSNHVVACTAGDFLNTPIELITKHYLNKKISVSYCGKCVSGEHKTGLFSADHENIALQAGRWLVAEQIGDWGGAVPTLMLQHYAPQFMDGIGRISTYIVGDAFRSGADNSAKKWGAENGLAKDAPEIKQRADEVYSHEMKHVSLAVVWTGFSTAIALASLKVMGDDTPLAVNAAAKLAGISTSFLGVLGTRAFAPEAAQKWDKWGSEHIFTPATRVLGDVFGIEQATVDNVLRDSESYRSGSKWLGKVNEASLAKAI